MMRSFCILAAILWVLNPRLHTILVQPGKLRVLAVLAHMSSFKSTSEWENLGWLPSLWPKKGSSIEISECIQLIFVQHTPNMPMFKPGLSSMPIYIQKQQVERLDGNIAMWLVFDASISPSTHDFFPSALVSLEFLSVLLTWETTILVAKHCWRTIFSAPWFAGLCPMQTFIATFRNIFFYCDMSQLNITWRKYCEMSQLFLFEHFS